MYFCNKCGKQIESGIVCHECAIAEYEKNSTNKVAHIKEDSTSFNYTPFPEPNNRMYGFGKALTAAILSEVAFFFSYFALVFSLFMDSVGIALIMVSIIITLVPLFLGIHSIKLFIERKSTCVKPIPTLILGISALPFSGLSILYIFLAFMIITV